MGEAEEPKSAKCLAHRKDSVFKFENMMELSYNDTIVFILNCCLTLETETGVNKTFLHCSPLILRASGFASIDGTVSNSPLGVN